MKIKEVCERTGLTRRAVRFYEEKGLVSPDIDAGNEYRDYSEADVRRLRLVARLREYRFSVGRIRRLLDCPQEAEEVFSAHRRELADEHAERGSILAALEGLRLPSGSPRGRRSGSSAWIGRAAEGARRSGRRLPFLRWLSRRRGCGSARRRSRWSASASSART